MKNIVDFLNESKVTGNCFKVLWDNFFGGLEVEKDENDALRKIITDFTKGAKSLKIEASEEGKSYWEGMNVEPKLIELNDDVKDEVEDLPGNAQWEVEEMFALTVNGDTLLVRCNWDDDPNGEYFDLKVTAFK
jgi:hypothetical protein